MSDGKKTVIEGALSGVSGVLETDVVKQAYADLLQPVLKATGNAGATAIHLFVQKPMEAIAAVPQKVCGMVERIRNRVPENRLLAAPAEVAGPVLEGIRYLHERHPLFEMYEELLTRSCDSDTRDVANPAFAEIIKVLSPDEARLLYWICQQNDRNIQVVRKTSRHYKSPNHKTMWFAEYGTEIESIEIPYWILGTPTFFHAYAYLRHLQDLGLIHEHAVHRFNSENRRIDVDQVHVSAYGRLFCEACIPQTGFTAYDDDFNPSHWESIIALSGGQEEADDMAP